MKAKNWTLCGLIVISKRGLEFAKDEEAKNADSCTGYVDLNKLRGQGCKFKYMSSSSNDFDEGEVVTEYIRLNNGVFKLHPGDCLVVEKGSSTIRIFNILNADKTLSLFFDRINGKYINSKMLKKMREAVEHVQKNKTPIESVTIPNLISRLKKAAIAGAKSMYQEWQRSGKADSNT